MTAQPGEGGRASCLSLSPFRRAALIAASYATLGALLVWSRVANLGQPLCCDEIQTVTGFVQRGPGTILAGQYVPNNHELYSLAGWATTSLFGPSDVALRLWSVVPFVAGVVIVTAWLHVRVGTLSAVLFLLLATASPLLTDASRQARGYGLAFLAMSSLIVAALEATSRPRTRTIVAFCASGILGTWTLPHFAIAFFATGLVLLGLPVLRKRLAVGLSLSAVAIGVWYLPHARSVLETPAQDYGAPIHTRWLLTAPIDQTLVSAFTQGADAVLRPGLGSLVLAAGFVVLISASPLLRTWATALVLCSGTATTIVVAWLTGGDVVSRFFSFLLVPLLLLVASGTAAILTSATRAPSPRVAVAAAMLVFVTVVSGAFIARVVRFPRESLGEVASAIEAQGPSSTPVYAYVPYSADLAFHLGRPVQHPRTPSAAARACEQSRTVFFVEQPWLLAPARLTCLTRQGVRHERFEQYTRGGRVDLWLIPPAREEGR